MLNLSSNGSTDGENENFKVFVGRQHYDVICLQIPGKGASTLLLPSARAHGRVLTTPNKRSN